MDTHVIRALAFGMALALLTGSPKAAQTPADYQALKKEMDALRQRLDAMQREIDTLKGQPGQGNPMPPPTDIVLRLDKAPIRGSESATVALVEVSDFECPFCGRYFHQTAPQIVKDYVESGKIRYAFVNLPLDMHKLAFKAAEAAECAADQGKYWEMHDRLFANQTMLTPAQLPAHAVALALNADRFKACLDTNKHAVDVRNDVAMVQRLGVTATPTFFIGTLDSKTRTLKVVRRIVGAKPMATFQEAIDSLLRTSSSRRSS
jgi:protein-disulfide isomerase